MRCLMIAVHILMTGCGPIASGAVGVASGLYSFQERRDLELRVEALEKQRQPPCLLLCDWPHMPQHPQHPQQNKRR